MPCAKSLIRRSTATPHPSIIIPVWPVGTNTADWPAARADVRSSSATDILPIAQSVADRQDHPLARPMAAADRGLHPLGRSSVVDDRRSRAAAAAFANSGSSPRNVWRPPTDIEAGVDRGRIVARHAAGSLPPVGAMPMSSESGGVGEREGLGQGRHDRDVVAGQKVVHVPAGPGRIEDRDTSSRP